MGASIIGVKSLHGGVTIFFYVYNENSRHTFVYLRAEWIKMHQTSVNFIDISLNFAELDKTGKFRQTAQTFLIPHTHPENPLP
jgi:hypothetical protein